VNGVAENSPSGVIASEAGDAYTVEAVKRDDVGLPCARAADNPARCIAGANAAVAVTQLGAVNVRADFVTLDHYACRTTVDKDSISTRIDYITRARRAGADGSIRRLRDVDSVEERIKGNCASRVHADQVSLDRSINCTVKTYAADRDAVACRVDDVAGAGCAATNCDSGPFLDIDSSSQRADGCCPRGIGAEIVALH
jgi:hypothetical protein